VYKRSGEYRGSGRHKPAAYACVELESSNHETEVISQTLLCGCEEAGVLSGVNGSMLSLFPPKGEPSQVVNRTAFSPSSFSIFSRIDKGIVSTVADRGCVQDDSTPVTGCVKVIGGGRMRKVGRLCRIASTTSTAWSNIGLLSEFRENVDDESEEDEDNDEVLDRCLGLFLLPASSEGNVMNPAMDNDERAGL